MNDYLVWVAAADAQDLREFVVDHLATHPSVAHAETSLIYEHRRGPGPWRNRNTEVGICNRDMIDLTWVGDRGLTLASRIALRR